MSIELVIGRAKSGKSHYLAQKIEEIHTHDPQRNIYYLTPEQITFSIEYELSASTHLNGLGMIEVLSFERLCKKVFANYGSKSRVILDDLGKIMLLRKVIAENSENLPHFQLALKQFGLLESISETLDEFNRTGTDAQLIATTLAQENNSGLITAKAAEIALISTKYSDALLQAAYLDKSNLLNELTELLKTESIFTNDIIFVDGFEYFTKQQILLLEQLMKQAIEVKIALCCDNSADTLFLKQQKNIAALKECAWQNNLEITMTELNYDKYYQNPALKFLEQNYTVNHRYPKPDSALEIIECQNPKAEIEMAAALIRNLVREQNIRYNDIALMVSDINIYQNYLAKTFLEYDLPYFLDENSRIFSHPLPEMISAIFMINDSNWSYQSIFSYLRSGLLCVETEEIDLLENYTLSCGIHGAARWLNPQPWSWQGKRNEWEREAPWDETTLFHINDIRTRIVAPLAELLKKLRRKQTVQETLAHLVNFLEAQKVPEQLANWQKQAITDNNFTLAQIHGQIWETICSIFDQLVEICGEEILSLTEIGQILESALKNINLGKIPLGLDQIFVGTPKRSRLGNIKVVILLGANDSQIPAKATAQGIFTLAELNLLKRWGWADTLEKIYDEEFSIYKTLTAPNQYLYLTYALADIKGKALRPSPLVSKIEKLFPNAYHLNEDEFWTKYYLDYKISLAQALKDNTDSKSQTVLAWYRANEAEKMQVLDEMLHNSPNSIIPLQSYTNVLNLSVSALEKYRSCPYAYFLNYTLHLKERDIYSLDAMNTGQFYHKALEELTDRLLMEGVDWHSVTDEHLDELIKIIVENLLPQLKNEILLSQGRYKFIKDKLYETISKSAHNLALQSRMGAFTTLKSEYSFGYGNDDFTITLEDNTIIRLQGRIDLIEQAKGRNCDYLRIIDFKSGANDLPLDEVYYGLKIQLLVYLKAAMQKMPNYKEAGVLYRYIKNPFIKSNSRLSPNEAKSMYLQEIKPKGLLLGEFEPLYLADNNFLDNQYSEILPFKLKKEGKEYLKSYGLEPPDDKNINDIFAASSAVASHEQLQDLQKHIDKLILATGEKIIAGQFAPHPYRYKSKNGCDYCHYGSICRFNTLAEPPYNKLAKISSADIWQNIKEES